MIGDYMKHEICIIIRILNMHYKRFIDVSHKVPPEIKYDFETVLKHLYKFGRTGQSLTKHLYLYKKRK